MFRYHSVMVETRPRGIRTSLSALAMSVMTPAALVLAPGAGADPGGSTDASAPVVDLSAAPVEALPAPPVETLPAPEAGPAPEALPAPEAAVVEDAGIENNASAVVAVGHVHPAPEALGPGVAPEGGLQVQTIAVGRNISADFPQIHSMIGVRPDAKPWHPSGRALDVMIPEPGSAAGIALGDAIMSYALRNAARFGIQDVIWRGTYYTPAGPSGSGYGHYDHVHITTFGGGYPSGDEVYLGD